MIQWGPLKPATYYRGFRYDLAWLPLGVAVVAAGAVMNLTSLYGFGFGMAGFSGGRLCYNLVRAYRRSRLRRRAEEGVKALSEEALTAAATLASWHSWVADPVPRLLREFDHLESLLEAGLLKQKSHDGHPHYLAYPFCLEVVAEERARRERALEEPGPRPGPRLRHSQLAERRQRAARDARDELLERVASPASGQTSS